MNTLDYIPRKKMKSTNLPFEGTLFSEYNGCNCCCPDTGNILYFLLEDHIEYIPYKEKNGEGFCFYGPLEGVELGRENKFDRANKTIYMNLRLPVCKEPDLPEVDRAEPFDYPHTLFSVVKVENSKVFIERFFDRGIPEKFRDGWNRASVNTVSSSK